MGFPRNSHRSHRRPDLVAGADRGESLFSTDVEFLKKAGREIAEQLKQVKGVVDIFDGLVFTGPTLSLRVRSLISERFGLTASDVAAAVNTAMLGQLASSVLEGDRVVNIRVRVDRRDHR